MKRVVPAGLAGLVGLAGVAASACRGACGPLTVTADGEEIRMTAGFGARVPARLGGGYAVSVFNHGGMDCATYLKGSRAIRQDELEARAYLSGERTNVSVNFSNEMGVQLRLLDEPRRVGDRIAVCVPEPVVHTGDMAYKRKRVVVQGIIAGTFCGEGE